MMRETIAWTLGLAAIAAGLRGLWLHHCDNQAVIRTDLARDAFAAGQAAERTRAAEEADTARRAAYFEPPLVPDEFRSLYLETFREHYSGRAEEEGPPELAPGWQVFLSGGARDEKPKLAQDWQADEKPKVIFLPPGMTEADFVERDLGSAEPEGPGWSEWDDGHGGTP